MIEVEKKFQPNGKELEALLADAEFIGEKTHKDAYYDYPDFRLFKKGFRLRNRDGRFELKIKNADFAASGTTNSEEIDKEPQILERLGFSRDAKLAEIVDKDFRVYAKWKTQRRKYRKEDFTIDVDETSFGYNVCEIEVMVEHPEDAAEAERKIVELAEKYGFALTKLPTKLKEYLRVVEPGLYPELGRYV